MTDPGTVRADQWQSLHDTFVRDVRKLGLAAWFEQHNPTAQGQLIGSGSRISRQGIVRFIQCCQLLDRATQQSHEAVELIAVDARHLQHHVDAGAAQLRRRNHIEADETSAFIPDRVQPEGMQNLAFNQTKMAHRFSSPQAERDLLREAATVLGFVSLDQLLEGLCSRLVSGSCREFVGLEGIKVAPTRHVRVADGIASGTGRNEFAGEPCQQCLRLARLGQMAIQTGSSFHHRP